MDQIKAFVGHSFLSEDEQLVRKFTGFLDTVQKTIPGFDWVHATEPRPGGVPDKVLDLIEGRNLFIGICSRNERASKQKNFSGYNLLFQRGLKISERDLAWKTSDWIIQEIGLAIGRGMKLILLLENGVRIPGGLFGDLEYIAFDREHPEASFNSILGMISQLSTSVANHSEASAVTIEEPAKASSTAVTSQKQSEPEEPSEDWDFEKYDLQLFISIVRKDKEREALLHKAFSDNFHGTAEEKAKWAANTQQYKIIYGEGGSLYDLQQIALKNPSNTFVQEAAARASAHFSDHNRAKIYYRSAIEHAQNDRRKVALIGDLAALDQEDVSLLDRLASMDLSPEDEELALSKLRELGKVFDEKLFQVAMLERELAIDAADVSKRFQVAYLNHDIGNKALSLYHYLRIPTAARSATTWNNLGVGYRDFSANGKSVQAYKNAAAQGESLAMSNLAYICIDAGLFEEARGHIKAAQSLEHVHPNVATALVRLNEAADSEDEKVEAAIKNKSEESEFLSRAGQKILMRPNGSIGDTWGDQGFTLRGSISDGAIELKGTHIITASEPVNALAGTKAESEQYSAELTAELKGLCFVGMLKRRKSGMQKSILDWSSSESKVIGYISDNLDRAHILWNNKVLTLSISNSSSDLTQLLSSDE